MVSDSTGFYDSADHGATLHKVQGKERHYLVPVALIGVGKCGFHEHAVAPFHTMIYAGMKRLLSLRGPGSSSEADARKLKIYKVSSSGRYQER